MLAVEMKEVYSCAFHGCLIQDGQSVRRVKYIYLQVAGSWSQATGCFRDVHDIPLDVDNFL